MDDDSGEKQQELEIFGGEAIITGFGMPRHTT